MKHIDPIHNLGYNSKGHFHSGRSHRLKNKNIKPGKPIDAITFDAVELSGIKENSNSWLVDYITDLPDSVVRERIKKFRDSFDCIEGCLAEKLIIEEI